MWLVIMVKGGEESRWHRRRASKVVEEEVRDFLDVLTTLLRVGDWFRASHAQKLRQATMKAFSFASSSYHDFDLVDEMKKVRNWNQDDLHELLQSLKGAFRLRSPRRSLAEPLHKSYSLGFRSLGTMKSPRIRRGMVRASLPRPSIQESAAAYFMGTDLMHAIGVD
jgi:hypothetical protein